jgi:hypothetical protein
MEVGRLGVRDLQAAEPAERAPLRGGKFAARFGRSMVAVRRGLCAGAAIVADQEIGRETGHWC